MYYLCILALINAVSDSKDTNRLKNTKNVEASLELTTVIITACDNLLENNHPNTLCGFWASPMPAYKPIMETYQINCRCPASTAPCHGVAYSQPPACRDASQPTSDTHFSSLLTFEPAFHSLPVQSIHALIRRENIEWLLATINRSLKWQTTVSQFSVIF